MSYLCCAGHWSSKQNATLSIALYCRVAHEKTVYIMSGYIKTTNNFWRYTTKVMHFMSHGITKMLMFYWQNAHLTESTQVVKWFFPIVFFSKTKNYKFSISRLNVCVRYDIHFIQNISIAQIQDNKKPTALT